MADGQDRFRVTEMFDDVVAEVAEDSIGVPVAPAQPPVHPVGS